MGRHILHPPTAGAARGPTRHPSMTPDHRRSACPPASFRTMEGCCSASPCLTGQRISICSVASPRVRPRVRRRPCWPTDVRVEPCSSRPATASRHTSTSRPEPTRASRKRRCARSPASAELPHDALRERADVLAGAPALHHLFAVTSGLESIAVGEEEIAGQVRRAYEAARETSRRPRSSTRRSSAPRRSRATSAPRRRSARRVGRSCSSRCSWRAPA